MKNITWKILCIMMLFLAFSSFAQSKKKLHEQRRQQFALNNQYLAINMNALLTGFTSRIEFEMDSVILLETDPVIRQHQIQLKSLLVTSISQAAFHSDALVAAIDSWTMCYQFVDFSVTPQCRDQYGNACDVIRNLFNRYARYFEDGLHDYIDEEDRNGIRDFATENPVFDIYLTRKTIVHELSEWVSSDEFRLKSGLINMNDLMRLATDQLEYYASVAPKQAMWQLDMRLGEMVTPDSLALLMNDMRRVLNASADMLEQSREILRVNRDTILANLDYQRRMSFYSISREREQAMQAISEEREIVMETLHQERLAVQDFMAEQRQLVTSDINGMTGNMLDQSVDAGKELIDYMFFRLLILSGIGVVFIFIAIWVFRKL